MAYYTTALCSWHWMQTSSDVHILAPVTVALCKCSYPVMVAMCECSYPVMVVMLGFFLSSGGSNVALKLAMCSVQTCVRKRRTTCYDVRMLYLHTGLLVCCRWHQWDVMGAQWHVLRGTWGSVTHVKRVMGVQWRVLSGSWGLSGKCSVTRGRGLRGTSSGGNCLARFGAHMA